MTRSEAQQPELPHRLTIDERQHLEVTGIREVLRFDERQVSLRSEKGVLILQGEGLRLKTLAPENGRVVVDGRIDNLAYTEDRRPAGMLKKLFG